MSLNEKKKILHVSTRNRAYLSIFTFRYSTFVNCFKLWCTDALRRYTLVHKKGITRCRNFYYYTEAFSKCFISSSYNV